MLPLLGRVEGEHNLLTRDAVARERKVGIIARVPLASGLLTGKLG
jgi:aryl-alcohol dehydrogenase-like predicted oxidoreductase